MLCRQLHDERAGHDQRLLIGYAHSLTRFKGSPGPGQPRRPNDRGHDDVDVGIRDHGSDPIGTE
jgi:hypothetical protein